MMDTDAHVEWAQGRLREGLACRPVWVCWSGPI